MSLARLAFLRRFVCPLHASALALPPHSHSLRRSVQSRLMSSALVNDAAVIERVCASPLVTTEDGATRPLTLGVVGISTNPDRPSFFVSRRMQELGYGIIPINPVSVGTPILGTPCVASLADVKEPVDVCVVFRAAEHCPDVARQAAANQARLGTSVFWMQSGIVSEEACETASAAGMAVVMDKCVMVEANRLQARG